LIRGHESMKFTNFDHAHELGLLGSEVPSSDSRAGKSFCCRQFKQR
jgi:hypothetical protein